MRFTGIKRTFSTVGDGQYETIGAFWDEYAEKYGLESLMGLGCGWTADTIDYVMALKEGVIDGADFEAGLPDEWSIAEGRTDELSAMYDDIYKDGPLLYEIEEFFGDGSCRIRYCRSDEYTGRAAHPQA